MVRERIAMQDEELVGPRLGLWTVLQRVDSVLLSTGTVEILCRAGPGDWSHVLIACGCRDPEIPVTCMDEIVLWGWAGYTSWGRSLEGYESLSAPVRAR